VRTQLNRLKSAAAMLLLLSPWTVYLPAQTSQPQTPAGRGRGQGRGPRPPFPEQARSVVVNRGGIVAASQTLAAQAGAAILGRGGTAIDAAIAANAVLGLTEPVTNGLGGDLLAIVYEANSKKLYGLNSTGWAPAGLSIDYLRQHGIGGRPPAHSIHFATVPGAVAGWDALHKKFGKLPFSELMAPAIYYAEQGFPVQEHMAELWNQFGARLANIPGFSETFLPGGRAPKAGEIFQNRALAESLGRIAEYGRDGFYKGPLAKQIVDYSASLGGTMTLDDLEKFQPEWVQPVSTTYRGWTVWELPPNTIGIAALSMLNILERFPMAEYGQDSARALHLMIEAKKLAYADLTKYDGDPAGASIPVEALVSKDLAAERSKLIDPAQAHCQVLPSDLTAKLNGMGKDTTYLSVVDGEGNIVSFIQSVYNEFGTGLVVPGAGFPLHDRGGLFDFEAGKVNSLASHKRPMTTLMPGFMEKGDVRIGFGIMGGFNQAQAHAQFVSNIVDFGFSIQAALEAPRFTKLSFDGCDALIESTVPEAVRNDLTKLGHQLRALDPFAYAMGRGNAVMVDDKGIKYGASDPRGDGEAIPQPPPTGSSRR
jgi:gamma-glutamyltranspeptidase/glutathione hydrolase